MGYLIDALSTNLSQADPETLRLAARQRLYQLDMELCWREQFKIQTKDMRLLPLIPNPVQAPLLAAMKKQLEKTGRIRQLWFKCRQPGASTIASAVVAHKTYFFPNVYSFVVAQDKTTVERIFGMHTVFHENMASDIRPNKQYHVKGTEIALGNPDPYTRDDHPGLRSRILVGEAKNINVGTGFTIHVIHLCLGPNNYVIDAFGPPKKLSEINPHVNVITHNGNVSRAKAILGHSNVHKGLSIDLWGLSRLPLELTGNHKVLTSRGFVEASKISVDDELTFPLRKISGKISSIEVTPIQLPEKGRNGGHRYTGLKATIPLTYDMGWVLGLYLAEGCILNRDKRITFSLNRNEQRWVERIKNVLAPWITTVGTTFVKNHETLQVQVNGCCISEWIRSEFYTGEPERAWTKKLPDWIWDAPESFARGVVHGYLLGDGSFTQEKQATFSASSVSSALAIGIKELLQTLGYGWVSLSKRDAGLLYNRNCREQWMLRLHGVGARKLAGECGFKTREPQGKRYLSKYRYENGVLHVKVRSVKEISLPEVYDMEIDHADHTYRTLSGVVTNSEICRYPYVAPLTESLIPALSDAPGTIRIFESTAYYAPGGSFFKDQCERARRGETEYEYHFLEWWKMPEYSLPHVKREMRLSIEEKFLIKKFGLTIGNIKWRRQKISDYNGDEDAFRQNYPMTFEEGWITRESSTFPRDALMELRSELKPPLKTFNIADGRMYEIPDGDLKVWETPIKDENYFIGADVGEGNEDGDWSVASVIRAGTREQVAEYRGHILPRPYGDILAAIGRYYNTAQIAPETNDMGRSTVDRLREIYTNIYIWRKRDTIVPTFSKLIGWETTHGSKILLVNLARELLYTRQVRIHSSVLWNEMASFIRDYTPTGLVTYRAATGHDDAVLAWMIGLQIREDEDYSRYAATDPQPEKKIDATDKAYYDAEGLNIATRPDYLDEIRDWD